MTRYPTKENPDGVYKFVSFDIYVTLDALVTERESYSLLEWLGDIGGLLDALQYIGRFLVGPVAAFSLKTQLLGSVFRR